MNVKTPSQNNSNINLGQAEIFDSYDVFEDGESIYIECSKEKRIKITPMYTVHKTKHDEVLYKIELEKRQPFSIKDLDLSTYQSVTQEPFNVKGKEMQKFMNFLLETFALEKTPVNTLVAVDSKETAKELIKKFKDDPSLFETLSTVDLDTIDGNIAIQKLKKIRDKIIKNMDTGTEREFWHPFLKENHWILSQLFAAPYLLFQDEFYVGGKMYNNKGEVRVDFGLKNIKTRNCAIIEIKDAKTELISSYRGTEYRASTWLAGAVNQAIKQREHLYKYYFSTQVEGNLVNNIKSILIIGKLPENQNELEAFELFRNELRNIEIITFDELLEKIDMQIKIIQGEF